MVKAGQIAHSKTSLLCVDFGLLGAELLCMHTSDNMGPRDRVGSV